MNLLALEQRVTSFVGRVRDLAHPIRASYQVGTRKIRSTELPPEWSDKCGIYAFFAGGEVEYIGRAVLDSLGARVVDQLKQRGDSRWDSVVDASDVHVEIFAWAREHSVWIPSLEVHLIREANPRFNKRKC